MRDASAPFSSIPTSLPFPYRSPHLASPSVASPRPIIHARGSVDSNISVKSLKDTEREMAELRLAMVGMGKAMDEWLSSLGSDSEHTSEQLTAREGLGRVRDTLLDAAGKEVDEIVKEWGWHDGLEASRHQDSLPISLTSNPSISTASPIPVDVGFDGGDVTPTALTTPVLASMPPVPRDPSPFRSVPIQNHASGSRPALYLSSRNDTPIAALPRVPVTASARAESARMSSSNHTSWPAKAVENMSRFSAVEQGEENETDGSAVNSDPLAGMGVSMAKVNAKRRAGSRGSGEVDPLLGVGVR